MRYCAVEGWWWLVARRETVAIDFNKTAGIIKAKCRSYTVFCERMGRGVNWVTDWKRGHNLPSPEEAARTCAILGVEPAEILVDQADIDKVTALLEAERPQKNQPATEDDELNKKFLAIWESLTDENRRRVEDYIALLANAQRNQ